MTTDDVGSQPLMSIEPNGLVKVWELRDGTVVSSVRGPDGAAVTVMLRSGELDVTLQWAGQEWRQTVTYRKGEGMVSGSQPTSRPSSGEPTLLKRTVGRPRTRTRPGPLTLDDLTGAR